MDDDIWRLFDIFAFFASCVRILGSRRSTPGFYGLFSGLSKQCYGLLGVGLRTVSLLVQAA